MKFCVLVFSVIALSACGVLKSLSPNEGKDVSVSGYSKDANAVVNIEELHMVSAYELAATRSTNKMLDESVDIYEKKPQPKIYIKKIEKVTEKLPDGLYRAQNAIDEIIKGSGTYVVVDKIDDADYILASTIEELKVNSQPTIQFKMTLNDKEDKPNKAWSVIIKQMSEDNSWQ